MAIPTTQDDLDTRAAPQPPPPPVQANDELALCVFPELSATIPAALVETQRKLARFPESRAMAEHVHERLASVFARLAELTKLPHDALVVQFCAILARFQRYLRTPVSQISVGKFARSRRVRDANHVFHSEIDALLDLLQVADDDPLRAWKDRFGGDFQARFGEGTGDLVSSCVGLSEDKNHADAVTLVRFGVEALVVGFNAGDSEVGGDKSAGSDDLPPGGNAQENESRGGAAAEGRSGVQLVQFGSSGSFEASSSGESIAFASAPPEEYPWFLPLHEVAFDESDCVGEGAFGAAYRGVWLNHPVVIKYMGYEEDFGTVSAEMFHHEVRVWYQLWHPHIVQLYGACHTGKRYFVSEYACHGSLTEYLSARERERGAMDDRLKWVRLYEVALGVQYLHLRCIVHNDLKCDNILVGEDEKAKIIDFGLSSIPERAEIMVSVKKMGAVHWKSPEYLAGGRPSLASDIYSLAMCIVEALEGDYPWGRNMNPSLVKFHVKKGRIPERPASMADSQWQLITAMTAMDPAQRLKISSVVDVLGRFAVGDFETEWWLSSVDSLERGDSIGNQDTAEVSEALRTSDINSRSWRIPASEVVFDERNRIGRRHLYRGNWLSTPVVIKFVDRGVESSVISARLFRHEVEVWYRLTHPNIAKLYGANDNDKRFLVYEFASNGMLRQYLQRADNNELVWEKLYEAALGLQYLHGRNIVHNNLTCNNILVGADGRAKLIDFGLSSILNKAEVHVDPEYMGAVHWKSPEYILDGRSSFASDVYSFAMCIVEAVSGKIPWRRSVVTPATRFKALKQRMPKRPDEMNDCQWRLIERMTAPDPRTRVKISYVVAALQEIVQAEKSARMP